MNSAMKCAAMLLLWVTGLVPVIATANLTAAEPGDPNKITVPLIIENGRPHVQVTFAGPDASPRTARFLVDTGGGAFIIPESVAAASGLGWGETFRSEGRQFARPDSIPDARLETFALPLVTDRVLIAIGGPQGEEDPVGLLPGHILAKHHVILDFPGQTLTLATPGSVRPQGEPMPMPVSSPMGFPRTEIEVGGEIYGMLLDTGPPTTIISQVVLDKWHQDHPDWQRYEGAWGEGKALARAGGQVLETMVIENIQWGPQEIKSLTVASQREGVFEEWISPMMTAPVVGALGSNVFRHFRIELDYLNQTLYVSRPRNPEP